jgi:hypothetical protein
MLELEADRDALLESMARMVTGDLDRLTGEERNKVYRMLRLEVIPRQEDGYDVTGAFCSLEPIRPDENRESRHGDPWRPG